MVKTVKNHIYAKVINSLLIAVLFDKLMLQLIIFYVDFDTIISEKYQINPLIILARLMVC
jgi:uncharacterized membrane protein YbhN (UPF0104 family)